MTKKILLTFMLTALLFATGCSKAQTYKKTGFYLYNVFTIEIIANKKIDDKKAESILTKSLESLRPLDNRLNKLNPISDINAINEKAAKKPIKIAKEVFSMLEKAMTGAELTDGVFDISFCSLSDLFLSNKRPSNYEIKNSLKKIDYTEINLDLNYQTIRLMDKNLKINFAYLKKGFAIDLINKKLKRYPLQAGLIRSKNTLYAFGKNKKWLIPIVNPLDKTTELAKIPLKNKGFSSISAKDKVYNNAQRWLFLFRQSRGIDDQSLPLYTAVIAPNAVTAEVLAHSLFIMGPEKGLNLINKLKYEGVYIYQDENGNLNIVTTENIKKFFKGLK